MSTTIKRLCAIQELLIKADSGFVSLAGDPLEVPIGSPHEALWDAQLQLAELIGEIEFAEGKQEEAGAE